MERYLTKRKSRFSKNAKKVARGCCERGKNVACTVSCAKEVAFFVPKRMSRLSPPLFAIQFLPMVTTDNTVVAPRLVLAGISEPFSVFTSQNVTHEQHTINVNGT